MTLPRLPALFGAVLLCLIPSPVRAFEFMTGLLDRTFNDADGKEAKYVLFVPHDYKGDKEYPLILFLHGSGETGTDGKKQAKRRPRRRASKKQEKTFPVLHRLPAVAGSAPGRPTPATPSAPWPSWRRCRRSTRSTANASI